MFNKLKFRTTLMVIIVIFMTVIIDFIVGNTFLRQKMKDAFEKEAFTVVKAITRHIDYLEKLEKALDQEMDYAGIYNSMLDNYEKLQYIIVIDENGEITYGSGPLYENNHSIEEQMLNKLKISYNGSFLIEYHNEPYLSFFQPLYQEDGSGIGAIVVGYKERDVMEPIYLTTRLSLLISIIIGTISIIIISALINRWISNPLKRLIRATKHIGLYGAEGMPPIRIESRSEIGDLGKQYNLMMERLNKSMISKTYLDSIIMNMSDALFVLNTSMEIQKVNASALTMLGYSEQELIGKTTHMLFDTTDEFKECCEETLRQKGLLRNIETRMKTKDGRKFPILLCCSLMHNKRNGHVEIILNAKDITERKIMQDAISYRANHDMLTGLSNRYALGQAMEKVFMQMKENDGHQHIFLYMDLDNFKSVNDECGHNAGDELIKQLTQIIQSSLRETDILTRLGGDEFGALLLNSSMETGVMIGKRICEIVRKYQFRWENKHFKVGISVGAVAIDAYNKNPDQIIAMADQACYVSKENGGSYVEVAHPNIEMDKASRERMNYDIEGAIVNRKLHLEYQPVKDASGVSVTQYEVLLRMSDENGRLIPPSLFLPEVRRRHQCAELDEWVIDQAYSEYHTLAAKVSNPSISINLTKEAVEKEGFVAFIEQKTKEYGIPYEKICFEIEELQVNSGYSNAANVIRTLTSKGFRVLIDHFGSGLSGYTCFNELPIEAVKIDGCFIHEIADNELDTAFVSSIIDMIHLMGKKVIACHVESPQVLDKLIELGVDQVQGYYLGVPQTLEKLT